MAGEGLVTVEPLEAVAVGEAADFLNRLLRPLGTEQVEDAEVLPGARRGVDPGHIALVALRRLADAEAPLVAGLLEAAAVPDQPEVVGEVERVEELVRRR